MIFGLSGKPRAGKDTIADILVKDFQFTRVSFGDTLKSFVSENCGIDVRTFHDDNLKDAPFTFTLTELHIKSMISAMRESFPISESMESSLLSFSDLAPATPRVLLQVIGSDMCRDIVDKNIWIALTKKRIAMLEGNLVISDCRFPNEREAIRSLGGKLILVVRPLDAVASTHAAENSLGTEDEYNFIFNNDGGLSLFKSEVTLWMTLRSKL